MSVKSGLFGARGREFLREVAIVLLGVLIALVLEQIVDEWRERQRMEDIRASMNSEIADFAEVLSIRLRADSCIVRKVDALDQLLAHPERARGVRNVGRPPFYFSSRGAWNSDASDVLARYLGPERLRVYGEIYQGMEQFTELGQQEQDDWIALQTLEQQDEPLAGDRRWALVRAAAGARNSNLLMMAIAEQMTADAHRLGISRNHSLSLTDLPKREICQPLQTGSA
jgi:hypothetical protein